MHNGGVYGDGTAKARFVLDSEQREQLRQFAFSSCRGLVGRATIILLSASGKTNRERALSHATPRTLRVAVNPEFDCSRSHALTQSGPGRV